MLCNGIDILDFWRGTLSPRRLWVLLKHLSPRDSAFVRAAQPDTAAIAQWSATEYLLADLFDITAKAAFRSPKPYPRPAEALERRARDEARAIALTEQQQRIKRQREEGGA